MSVDGLHLIDPKSYAERGSGRTIRKGVRLVLFYASANRDADVIDAPGAVPLDRGPNPHLAFSHLPIRYRIGRGS